MYYTKPCTAGNTPPGRTSVILAARILALLMVMLWLAPTSAGARDVYLFHSGYYTGSSQDDTGVYWENKDNKISDKKFSENGDTYTLVLDNPKGDHFYFRIGIDGWTQWIFAPSIQGVEADITSNTSATISSNISQLENSNNLSWNVKYKQDAYSKITITFNLNNSNPTSSTIVVTGTAKETTPTDPDTPSPVTPTASSDNSYYLVGNFFSEDGSNIAVNKHYFRLKPEDGTTNKYSLHIPATLDVKTQIAYVKSGSTDATYYGPSAGNNTWDLSQSSVPTNAGLSYVDGTLVSESANASGNIWNQTARGALLDQEGSYIYEITVGTDGTPTSWKITYDNLTRVAYYLADPAAFSDATVYESLASRSSSNNNWDNRFYGNIYLPANARAYVLSNIAQNTCNNYDDVTHSDLARPVNKLYFQGNGDQVVGGKQTVSDQSTQDVANITYLSGGFKLNETADEMVTLEYNPTQGTKRTIDGTSGEHKSDPTKDIMGRLVKASGYSNQTVSVQTMHIEGPALQASGDQTWTLSGSNKMTYNNELNCWEADIVTTRDQDAATGDALNLFRFVGDEATTQWQKTFGEDSKEQADQARLPYTSTDATLGHVANDADPNKVIYVATTVNGASATDHDQVLANSNDKRDIIFNRPAGKWKVRLYLDFGASGSTPVTNYYYTITALPNSIYISPRNQIINFRINEKGERNYIQPTITVNTGEDTGTRYLVYTVDGTDPSTLTDLSEGKEGEKPRNNEVYSYNPSNGGSFEIGQMGVDKDASMHFTQRLFGDGTLDNTNFELKDRRYTITVKAQAVTKNSDGSFSLVEGATDEVTYTFFPPLDAVNLFPYEYTKYDDDATGFDKTFMGVNECAIKVVLGQIVPLPSTDAKASMAKGRPGMRRSEGQQTTTPTVKIGDGDAVFYHVYDAKAGDWGPTLNVPEDGCIRLHQMTADPESDDNKFQVWIESQKSYNPDATKTAKYDITYSTSEAGYKDAIYLNNEAMKVIDDTEAWTGTEGTDETAESEESGETAPGYYMAPRNDMRIFVYDTKDVYVKVGYTKTIDKKEVEIDLTPSSGTKMSTYNNEWKVIQFDDYDKISNNGTINFVCAFSYNESSLKDVKMTEKTALPLINVEDNSFDYDTSKKSFKQYYGEMGPVLPDDVAGVNYNIYPYDLGDKSEHLDLMNLLYTTSIVQKNDGMGDYSAYKCSFNTSGNAIPAWVTKFNGVKAEEPSIDENTILKKLEDKYFPNAIKIAAGSTVKLPVLESYTPSANNTVTVQMLVEPVDKPADGATVKATLNVNGVSEEVTFDKDTKGNVSKHGRVDVFSTGCDGCTSGTWREIEATGNGTGSVPEISITATGGDIYISNIGMFEDANTAGHIWTRATSDNLTSADNLSRRCSGDDCDGKVANAFSFFERGDNSNAIVFVSDKTVIGGVKNDTYLQGHGGDEGEDASLKASATHAPYNVAVTSDGGKTYTIDHLKLTDTDGTAWENKHKFGFNTSATVTASNITYDRKFSANKRQSICLPFALTSAELSELGIDHAYEFTGVKFDAAKNTGEVTWKDVTTTGTVAGTPYIVEFGSAPEQIDLTSSKVLQGKEQSSTGTGGSFIGVYNYQYLPANDRQNPEYWCYGSGNNRFLPSAYSTDKYKTDIKPFRGYFKFDRGIMHGAKALTFAIEENGTTTNIDPTTFMEGDAKAPIYNISGQMVSKDGNRSKLPRGVYIQNNKKFVVR